MPGTLRLRAAPAGLPDAGVAPPVVAESGDPFTAVRVVDLVARLERGRPTLISDIVDALESNHPGWLFEPRVVVDVLLSLQANWLADYRSQAGIEVAEGRYGPEVTIEDSTRVDPWIVRQALRLAAECQAVLARVPRPERG